MAWIVVAEVVVVEDAVETTGRSDLPSVSDVAALLLIPPGAVK